MKRLAAAVIGAFSLCTITGVGPAAAQSVQSQVIELIAICEGQPISDVSCTLSNGAAQTEAALPAKVTVPRNNADLVVQCQKGQSVTRGVFQSRSSGGLWGKLNHWGGEQFASQAGDLRKFDYPPRLLVDMPTPCR